MKEQLAMIDRYFGHLSQHRPGIFWFVERVVAGEINIDTGLQDCHKFLQEYILGWNKIMYQFRKGKQQMKTFVIFMGNKYYPSRMEDCIGTADTIEEVEKIIRANVVEQGADLKWCDVIHTQGGEISLPVGILREDEHLKYWSMSQDDLEYYVKLEEKF